MKKIKFLIIEDSANIVETISLALEVRWPDAQILSTPSGNKGVEMVEGESPDVVILDLGLPDSDGFDVLRRIRQFSRVPVLILTVRSEEADIVRGLEWGADDYMVKPFKQMELLARLKGIMRRSQIRGEETLVCGSLRFEPATLRLQKSGREINISRTEGLILAELMRNAGNVVSYTSLAEAMWGNEFPEASDSIKVHIRHLREKLEADPGNPEIILNRSGIGYLMSKPS